ncbi:hypothetical protein S40288_07708 [Stachybotrys chartarum IBT 40288]|nr:hypothetical protein S40288_07708 [Stachybotrys chartarum IBT 40288]
MPETASPDVVAQPVAPQLDQNDSNSLTRHAEASQEPTQPPADVIPPSPAPDHPHTNGHVKTPPSIKHEPPVVPESRTNGNADHHHNDDERPSKRRRTRDSTPPPPTSARKIKPESPPWKRIDADGPTSFTENGRRKSGRINTLPLDMQPPGKKRSTRRSLGSSSENLQKRQEPPTRSARTSGVNGSIKTSPALKANQQKPRAVFTPKAPPKQPTAPTRTSSRSTRRRTPSPPPSTRHPTRPQRASRLSAHHGEEQPPTAKTTKAAAQQYTGRSPRINLRVSRATTLPLVHPDQVRKRPKIGESFEDFWARANTIPVEEGGLLVSEEGPVYTDEMAQRDAKTMARIEKEAQPGGLLSRERCALFAPEQAEEPPRQYARQDHMVKAMSNFRRLLLAEQQRHRATARRLAEACRDEWLRRQPKTEEELEAEARLYWAARYRLVAKALFGTWENVRAQVNRRRLEEWEAEEQKRIKAALNDAVNFSEQQLQARRLGLDSELPSDEDGMEDLSDAGSLEDETGFDESELASGMGGSDMDSNVESDGIDDGDDEDSDNMSSDDDDEAEDQKDVGDETLTQEQLKAKYANMPELSSGPDDAESEEIVKTNGDAARVEDDSQATSDESVDMDDDMGSSDDESNDGDEDDDDDAGDSDVSNEEDSGDDTGGLLGLLFGTAEIKKMREEATDTTHQVQDEDVEMADATLTTAPTGLDEGVQEDVAEDDDEVSLIHHPGSEIKDQTDDEPFAKSTTDRLVQMAEATVFTSAPQPPDSTTEELDQDRSMRDQVLATERAAIPVPEDDVMADVPISPSPAAPGTDEPFAVADKAASPETEPVTNPPSMDRSQSPRTSETKPSEVDLLSTGEMALVKTQSRSATPRPDTSHKIPIPFLLRGTLREYQHDGLDWLAGLYANNTNGILADEMGLGKTIQTIALLAHLACHHEVWGPHLVVVPTSVMLNWEMEFKKWCPGFKILAYYGSQEERKRKRQGWNNDDVWNVCITSYQLVLQDQQVFKRRRWHYMILDEAHNIKNFKSQRWQTLLGFNTHSRLLLTGTPLQNNLTELWSLLFFLMPAENGVGGFADLQEFQDWFHKPETQILENGREQMDDEARAIISKLHKVLRPYLLRRLKADVEKQMPAKYEHVEFCRLSKRQRELYDGFLSRADTKATLSSGNYLSIINCLMQLRKVCNHPDLFVDRPIMTSLRMRTSVAADYEITEQSLRRSVLAEQPSAAVNLGLLNLIPAQFEHLSSANSDRITKLWARKELLDLRDSQRIRAQYTDSALDPTTVRSNLASMESTGRWCRLEELRHCVYLNGLRCQQRPVYGKNVIDLLTIGADRRPCRPKPRLPQKIMDWFEDEPVLINAMIPSLDERAESLKTTIEKFSCVTPAVITRDGPQLLLGRKGVEAFTDEDLKLSAPVRWAPFLPKTPPQDPWHEARMRLSIQFPDKRLLQYDCGKLQALDKLLRKLQTGGHRALIFTQMTKVLDILEQFLNIHGHKYLRLDGATKVEQRQILTDRFNNDTRILCFILSTRSGGLGINLTGADTVIFYDQDWNPAMDKQCQDRCHRIGQTRDVHIYRLVSEHTIEANILRKASQKQMLDDVVIQEGEFTTDYFNKVSVRDVLGDKLDMMGEGVSAADAALDRVLGGPDSSSDQRTVGRVLEQAEDKEDVDAARVAEREIQADDADFTERPSHPASGASTTRQGTPASKSVLDGGLLDGPDAIAVDDEVEYNAWKSKINTIDDYMLGLLAEELKHTKLELPKDKKKGKKKGKDTRKR